MEMALRREKRKSRPEISIRVTNRLEAGLIAAKESKAETRVKMRRVERANPQDGRDLASLEARGTGSRLDREPPGSHHPLRAACLVTAMLLIPAPALAGPPYVTDDPEPVDYEHYELYSYFTGGQARGLGTGGAPAIEYNYGFAPDSRIAIVATTAYERTPGVFAYGFGDTEISLKHRLITQDKDGWTPTIGVVPTIELPSGDAARGLGLGSVRAFFPIWLQKDWGDWEAYGGGGFWLNPGPAGKNAWFVGGVLQRKIDEKLSLGLELYHWTANEIGAKDTSAFNIGAIYDFDEHRHFIMSVGRGLQNVRDTNEFSWFVGFLLTGGDEKPHEKPRGAPIDWTGFHVGADLGLALLSARSEIVAPGWAPLETDAATPHGVVGAYGGYDHRFGPLVLGAEVDAEAGAPLGARKSLPFGLSARTDALASARGRAGIAFDRALPFVTGGVALADVFGAALGESQNAARVGWTLGAGVDYAFAEPWSLRFEFRHVDIASARFVSTSVDGAMTRNKPCGDALRAGLTYRFDFSE